MKGCPPCADIDRMLTIAPSMRSRRMILAASCMRKNGARVLTANMRSNSSGEVSKSVPRSVMPAALTSTSTRPKARSAAAITARVSSMTARSARTNSARQPCRARSAATARPRSALRPQMTRPRTPRSANRRATASPSPCVPPVTTATLPSSCVLFRSWSMPIARFAGPAPNHRSYAGGNGVSSVARSVDRRVGMDDGQGQAAHRRSRGRPDRAHPRRQRRPASARAARRRSRCQPRGGAQPRRGDRGRDRRGRRRHRGGGYRRAHHLHADRHACRSGRTGRPRRQGDLLREAGQPRCRAHARLPARRRGDRHGADDRLQPPLRPELRDAPAPHRATGRSARSSSSRFCRATPPRHRRTTWHGRAGCSGT